MTEYTREQLNKVYKGLPQELKDWTSSEEMNNSIYQVFEENDILDNRANIISALIRNTLYGLSSPERFYDSLINEVGLDQNLAKKVGQEINRFVFFPVKELLAQLYQTNSATDSETKESPAASKSPEEEKIPNAPVPTTPREDDSYREEIE
ncbi:MAG: hypothetical protein Q8N56_02335 [bacterium]|nr:hypothetical protein [bacterium]